MISPRIAQLDVNKPFKPTKRDLELIVSFTFDRKDRFIEYSVALSTKLDKVINILVLTLNIF